MDSIEVRVGKKIKALRNKKGFSQEALAFKSRLHRTYISDIERGLRNVSIKNIDKIARALNVNPEDLIKTG